MSYLLKVHLNFQGQKVKEVYKNKIVVTSGWGSGERQAEGGREWDVISFEHNGSSGIVKMFYFLSWIKCTCVFLHIFIYFYIHAIFYKFYIFI